MESSKEEGEAIFKEFVQSIFRDVKLITDALDVISFNVSLNGVPIRSENIDDILNIEYKEHALVFQNVTAFITIMKMQPINSYNSKINSKFFVDDYEDGDKCISLRYVLKLSQTRFFVELKEFEEIVIKTISKNPTYAKELITNKIDLLINLEAYLEDNCWGFKKFASLLQKQRRSLQTVDRVVDSLIHDDTFRNCIVVPSLVGELQEKGMVIS
jgi:hypothetical protein